MGLPKVWERGLTILCTKFNAPPRDTKPPTKKIWLYGKADCTLAKQLLTVFLDAMNQSSQPQLGLPMTSREASPGESICLERLNALTPRTMFPNIRELETPSLPRFVSLRNPSSRNYPMKSNRKFWSIIRSVNPSKSLSAGSLSYGSVSVNGVQDKVNFLNEYFTACFNLFRLLC